MAKKNIIITVMMAAIMLGGVGCTMNNLFLTKGQLATKQGLKYLQEKYGEEFTYAAPYGDSMSGTKEFLTTCASLPGGKILVQIENFRSDNPIYRDNYLAVKYQEQTIDMLKKCAASQNANANIYYEARKNGQSENLPATATFEEFLLDGRSEAIAVVEIKASEYINRTQIEQICNSCAENNSNMYLLVIVVPDDLFGTMSRKEINSFVSTGRSVTYVSAYIRNSAVSFGWHNED